MHKNQRLVKKLILSENIKRWYKVRQTLKVLQMDEEEMLKIVYSYAEKHKSFNLDLIDSFQDQWDEKGYLSDIQIQTLENIIDKFRMKKCK